jgi:tRNA modification GTPase
MSEPIFALSSGSPPAGVAIIRLSGDGVFDTVRKLTGTRRLPPARTAMLRSIHCPETHKVLDSGLVLIFPGPASFTGEDMAELHLHGSPAVVPAVQRALLTLGMAPAQPGEFTRRAFLNGRIDLTQAEALADLIAAETEAQRDQALANAGGRLRTAAEAWREALLALRAETEADLDFADEGDVSVQSTTPAIRSLIAAMTEALAAAPVAERIRQGLTIAVIGPVNTGKSSLVNAIAARDVAIVSPYAGTTRDVIEVHLNLAGLPVTLLDTAGLRDSDDPVEQEGIRRARARAQAADLVLNLGPGGEGWRVVNRIDESGEAPGFHDGAHHVSATTGAGLDSLLAALADWARGQIPKGEPALVTTARQAHLLQETLSSLRGSERQTDSVLRAESLRQAAHSLGKLTGMIDPEDVLGAIFHRFCIGK